MTTITLAEAKATLSLLIENALEGKETVITKHGCPVAKLVPIGSNKSQRFGALKGKLNLPADFDNSLEADELAQFEGKD